MLIPMGGRPKPFLSSCRRKLFCFFPSPAPSVEGKGHPAIQTLAPETPSVKFAQKRIYMVPAPHLNRQHLCYNRPNKNGKFCPLLFPTPQCDIPTLLFLSTGRDQDMSAEAVSINLTLGLLHGSAWSYSRCDCVHSLTRQFQSNLQQFHCHVPLFAFQLRPLLPG